MGERVMEREEESKIPVFSVLKNGAILKNIFIVDNPCPFSKKRNGGVGGGGDCEVEETLVVGRHPDCNIMLTHPSISRFHLQIHSIPSRQKLSVTDLSSVHGTWISDKKVEPGTRVEVKEGDTIRIGGSTRIYRLHWIPLTLAYDLDNPFVSPLDMCTVKEQHEEKATLEDENAVAAREALQDKKVVPEEGEVLILNGTHSSIFNEDPDLTGKEIPSVPLASWDSPLAVASMESKKHLLNEDSQTVPEFVPDIVEAEGDNSNSSCSAGEQLSDGCSKALDWSLLAGPTVEEAGNWSRHHEGKGKTEVGARQVMEVSAHAFPGDEQLLGTKTEEIQGIFLAWQPLPDIQSEVDTAIDQNQNSGMETETEEVSDETNDDSLFEGLEESEPSFLSASNQNPDAATLISSEGRSEEVNSLSQSEREENNERRGFISATLDVEESAYSSKQTVVVPSGIIGNKESQIPKSHAVRGVLSEMNSQGLLLKSAKRSTTCNIWSRRGKSASVLQIRTSRNESKPKKVGVSCKGESQKKEVTNDKSIFPPLHTGSEKLEPEIFTPGKENLTPNTHTLKRLKEIGDIKENKSSSKAASATFLTNIFSSNDIDMEENIDVASAELLEPEIFTPDKENLTPNSHMLKRLQEAGKLKEDKGSLKPTCIPFSSKVVCGPGIHSEENIIAMEKENQTVGAVQEKKSLLPEPEIFTPNKENLTPNSQMQKRVQEIGKLEENKGSLKSTRTPFSSKVVCGPDIHSKQDIIAMEKGNQMVGVVQEKKPELHATNRKLKLKQEELLPMRKTERVPFQPLLENSPAKSTSYTGSSSIAARRSSFANCSTTRSPSILSNGESKVKWTIVVDTSSLLDKESQKSLQLLQGLKGTQLVIPRTVLRELDGLKKRSTLLFRRTTEISSILEWIEECMVKTKWWIHLQSSSESAGPIAATPPASPHPPFSNCATSSSAFPFSLHQSVGELVSPTPEDHVLECALLRRKRNRDGHLVLLSNDVTLSIKAMAEGVLCETAREFYESLVNPFSERFMWAKSSPRGQTWCHLDDVVLRERYDSRSLATKKSSKGETAKGLKLILLHNSEYGRTV